MSNILNITSGDCAADIIKASDLPGEVFVWHDLLYEGCHHIGWPNAKTLTPRIQVIQEITDNGLDFDTILTGLLAEYDKLAQHQQYDKIILWFDACLFDQSMLVHILSCLSYLKRTANVELICINYFEDIEPFHGLGQLTPKQMESIIDQSQVVSSSQFEFAKMVDQAFAQQDHTKFAEIAKLKDAVLEYVPAAVQRWLLEQPDKTTGLGRLETLVLAAIKASNHTPHELFEAVAAADQAPNYWGDTTLWLKINGLATRQPPLLKIKGPTNKLPQWECGPEMKKYIIELI